MKIAYADPPYIGLANYYSEKEEIDHEKLLLELERFRLSGIGLYIISTFIVEIIKFILMIKSFGYL